MQTEKQFNGWLTLNWKNGKFKASARKPSKLGASDIPIEISLKVIIPEQAQMKATGTITLDSTKVEDMVFEEL